MDSPNALVGSRLRPGFKKRFANLFERYEFEVGILDDKPRRRVLGKKVGHGNYAKTLVRKIRVSKPKKLKGNAPIKPKVEGQEKKVNKKRKPKAQNARRKLGKGYVKTTNTQVSYFMRKYIKKNFYVAPFKSSKNRDILNLIRVFVGFVFGKGKERRLENTIQAVVRNPILRKDYGSNKPGTIRRKGFDHLMWDSAQMFRAIKAKVHKKGGKVV